MFFTKKLYNIGYIGPRHGNMFEKKWNTGTIWRGILNRSCFKSNWNPHQTVKVEGHITWQIWYFSHHCSCASFCSIYTFELGSFVFFVHYMFFCVIWGNFLDEMAFLLNFGGIMWYFLCFYRDKSAFIPPIHFFRWI